MKIYNVYDDEAGLIDVVDNEAAAKEFTKKYLGFFYEEVEVHKNVEFDRSVYKYDVYTESTYKDGKVDFAPSILVCLSFLVSGVYISILSSFNCLRILSISSKNGVI